MAKNRLNDFSTTAADNTDVGGVGIRGLDKPSNLDDGMRKIMAILADWREGTSLKATANFNDSTDTTKVFAFSGANIPTATTRSIDAEALYDLASDAEDIIALLTPKTLNYLAGYKLSNNAVDSNNDIDIAPGAGMDSTNTEMIVLAASITKRVDSTWTVGTDQGGLDTGTVASGTYHVFAIKRVDTGVVDALFSTSATSPTLPTNYTLFRRLGSVISTGIGFRQFFQRGDDFLFDLTTLDVDVSNQSTTAVLRALTVPSGIQVDAKIRVRGSCASGWTVIVSSPDVFDRAPASTANPLSDLGGTAGVADRATLLVRTDTSSQVRTRSSQASTELQIATYGWIDTRGK